MFSDLLGKKFGRLTVVRMTAERSKHGSVRWLCACQCGNKPIVVGDSLRCGETRSCGCLRTEMLVARTRTHGLSSHPLFRTWDHMKSRCFNPNNKEYHNYGGRGISVCPQWRRSFTSFVRYILKHLGPRPRGRSLDRKDNNRGYEPGNLRWATRRQQQINSRQRRALPRGVYEVRPGVYFASIKIGRRNRRLGSCTTFAAAVALRQAAERRYRYERTPPSRVRRPILSTRKPILRPAKFASLRTGDAPWLIVAQFKLHRSVRRTAAAQPPR